MVGIFENRKNTRIISSKHVGHIGTFTHVVCSLDKFGDSVAITNINYSPATKSLAFASRFPQQE